MKEKLAMIGVDAADPDFIRRHLNSLPAFRRVFETGAIRALESTADLLTGSVWPTFYTGTSPGEHGIYHHLQWDAEAMRLRRVSASWLDCEPFWYELQRRGLRVTALDVPMTFQLRLSGGIEVTNWGSHDQLGPYSGNCAEIMRDIRRRFGSHPMGAEIPVNKTAAELRRIHSNLREGARRKGELVRWLMGVRDWDFFLAVFGETHRGGHILWPDAQGEESLLPAGALLDVYCAVDEALGEILDSLDLTKTTVIVFSLHGMGPNTSQEHFVPRIMDLLNTRWVGTEKPAAGAQASAQQRSLMRRLRECIPARLQNAVAQGVPVAVRDWVVIRQISSGYDWPRTPGFPLLADYNGYLRLNLRGRERDGALDPDNAEAASYLERLQECFRSFRVVGTGEPLVETIRLTSREFSGKRVNHLPDVIVRWAPSAPADELMSEPYGALRGALATGRRGNHRPSGFCAILGWDESRTALPSPRHIADLAPIARRLPP